MRQFGEIPAGGAPERPGAYAILVDERWRVAVVRIVDRSYLPGGGIEGDESAVEALHREVAEETGLGIEILREVGVAAQIVPTVHGPVNKVGRYFLCRASGVVGQPVELDHELLWWSGTRAVQGLHHPAQGWMVEQVLASRTSPAG